MPATQSKPVTLRCPSCGQRNRVRLDRAADRPKCGACQESLRLDRPWSVGDSDLDQLLEESEVPVLVDFYADWCGPCRSMAPLLEAVAQERVGQALLAKIDTERHPRLAARYHVAALPTLILFQGGREVAREVGAVPRHQILRLLDQAPSPR